MGLVIFTKWIYHLKRKLFRYYAKLLSGRTIHLMVSCKLATEVVEIAGNLPLGLRVFGSHFRGLSKQEWLEELPRLRCTLDGGLESVLRFSYDVLCEEDKDLFLYISCIFIHGMVDYLTRLLTSRFMDIERGLTILAEKSLIHISEHGNVTMHHLLQQLGREIIYRECIHNPGKRRFLVDPRDISEVLAENTCLESLKCMNLRDSLDLKEIPDLARATNLETLDLSGCSSLSELPYSIHNLHKLKDLDIERCIHLEALPADVNLESLYYLNLNGCSQLRSFPQISRSISDLYLDGTAIEEVPGWIENISRLSYLSMNGCNNLKKISPNISKLRLLVEVDFSECKALSEESRQNHPEDICTSLMRVNMSGNSFERLPDTWTSIQPKDLDIGNCKNLVSLPELPVALSNLTANHCESLESLYGSFQQRQMALQFINCFKLNHQAREFILHSDCAYAILPGEELPSYFSHRADRNFLTASLPRIRKILSFKACMVVKSRACWFDFGVNYVFRGAKDTKYFSLSTNVYSKTNHLIIFSFDFSSDGFSDHVQLDLFCRDEKKKMMKIKECGVQLLEVSPSLIDSGKRFETEDDVKSGVTYAEASRSSKQMRVSMK